MASESLHPHGIYYIDCYDLTGHLCWRTYALNLVVDQGKDNMLDSYFSGTSYTASWYMSLTSSGTVAATSTYAVPQVTEVTNAVIAARSAVTWGTASGGQLIANPTIFNIIGSGNLTGNMVLTGDNTVGDVAASNGILFSAANFAGGTKTVSAGYTLTVTYTITL